MVRLGLDVTPTYVYFNNSESDEVGVSEGGGGAGGAYSLQYVAKFFFFILK